MRRSGPQRGFDTKAQGKLSVTLGCRIWVLRRIYRASREDIALTIESLLDDQIFELEQRPAVAEALRRFREGRADLADYLIGVKTPQRTAHANNQRVSQMIVTRV